MKIWRIAALMIFLAASGASAVDDMTAFPLAEEGMVRYVLKLDEKMDESAFKVELIVGKTVQSDPQNIYFFGGRIETETIAGWGYTRYIVREIGPLAGTLMAVDSNAPKVARFIAIGGEPFLTRYNSRLPIVIYVPEGVEVRCRIWSAGSETVTLEKG